MLNRYRCSRCSVGDEVEDETGGKLSLWTALICGQRRTVKNTATQVSSLEIAQKYAQSVSRRFNTKRMYIQFPHCLATHLSASDSLRPWRYTNLLTYLLTYCCTF